MQTTSHLLMIRPVNFSFNHETAVNNAFQVSGHSDGNVQSAALREFDHFVSLLKREGVDVTVVNDTPLPYTPDSIFPNNWISFHDNRTICLYPMFAENRRMERKEHVIQAITKKFQVGHIIDLSTYEAKQLYLEGTGSMVLDRDKKIAYACLSPRTDKKVLEIFCNDMGYAPVSFTAVDPSGIAIYHTNVMMCVGSSYVVICLDVIADQTEKEFVTATIDKSGKKIILITPDQMNEFAGNMLEVKNDKDEALLVMSTRAFKALSNEQSAELASHARIVHADLTTIEISGGGSARCMMAEVHLPIANVII